VQFKFKGAGDSEYHEFKLYKMYNTLTSQYFRNYVFKINNKVYNYNSEEVMTAIQQQQMWQKLKEIN